MRTAWLLLVLGLLLAGCADGTGDGEQHSDGTCAGKPTDGEQPLGPAGGSDDEILDVTHPDDLSGRRVLALQDVRDGDVCKEVVRIVGEASDGYSAYHDGAAAFIDVLNEDWEVAHDDGPRKTGPVAVRVGDDVWLFSHGAVVA